MPMTIRLTDREQDEIRKKCIEINKLLIKDNRIPLKESELIHKILEKSISYTKVGLSGEIIIDLD